MKQVFIKKYWEEERVTFYLHFENDRALRQIEIDANGSKIFLSLDNPKQNESFLYDQPLSEIEVEESDFITHQEFNEVWNIG